MTSQRQTATRTDKHIQPDKFAWIQIDRYNDRQPNTLNYYYRSFVRYTQMY